MSGPATPGQEGPSYGPPSLPQGWIAQWDATSKKYYFVQLSTSHSQWETPTHAAPTVGTPTQTPGQETSPFAQPGDQQVMAERGVEGGQNGPDGERGLTSMAMNTLLHSQGGGKPSNPLLGMAGQLLGGGGKHNQSQQSSNAGTTGIVGALAGSLLSGGRTKPNQAPQQNYSGQASQGPYGHQDGLMGKLGGIFGGANPGHQPNSFGYTESGQHQGGYTGQAPPSSYQPAGSQNTQGYTAQPPPSSYQSTSSQNAQGTSSYYNQQPSYPQNLPDTSHQGPGSYYNQPQQYPPNPQSGPNPGPNAFYNPQPSQQPQQQQPMYGAPQHQQQQTPGYGASPQLQQQYSSAAPPQQEPYPSPIYIGTGLGNLSQPQHHMFQGHQNPPHQGGMYGDGNPYGGPPQPPMGSHPNQGQHAGYPSAPQGQGGYPDMPGSGRW